MILELQPAGKPAPNNIGFPQSKEDFELLKSLGQDRAVTKFELRYDTSNKSCRTTGVKLYFKGGKEILIGKIGTSYTNIDLKSKSPASMRVEPSGTDSNGTYRVWRDLDSSGNSIDYWGVFYSPLYTDAERITKQIPAGYDIVGVQCTTDSDGYFTWINFTMWPRAQPIV